MRDSVSASTTPTQEPRRDEPAPPPALRASRRRLSARRKEASARNHPVTAQGVSRDAEAGRGERVSTPRQEEGIGHPTPAGKEGI